MHLVVVSHDKPGMAGTRARVRPAHLDYMQKSRPPARHIIGMPLSTDDESTMIGSLAIVEAPDRATVEAFAKGDPYAQAGIFASTEIFAIHPAFAEGSLKRILPKPE